MFEITLNGEKKQCPGPLTVAELVKHLDLTGRAVAVEVNDQLVPQKTHATTRLQTGDKVEVVTLVGGG